MKRTDDIDLAQRLVDQAATGIQDPNPKTRERAAQDAIVALALLARWGK